MSKDVLSALYAAAAKTSDHSRLVLDDLALTAGLAWKCPCCPWVNRIDARICGGCGQHSAPPRMGDRNLMPEFTDEDLILIMRGLVRLRDDSGRVRALIDRLLSLTT